jgi:hypothetical protein
MRTTVTIEDGLLEDAKRRADELDTTLSAYIEEALRLRMTRDDQPAERPPFRVVTFGGDGLVPGVSWDDVREIASEDEVDRFLRTRR